MSSHHDWAERIHAEHGATKPFAPENGDSLRFAIGDSVLYTNAAKIEFRRRITGFYRPSGPCSLYAQGARYFIDSCSPWMPVKELELRMDGGT